MGFQRGVSPSAKTLAKMRAAALGRVMSPETKEKIRQTRLGKKLTAATRDKIRASMVKRWATGHAGKKKFTVPKHLSGYAQKLRHAKIKGDEFRQAIEAAL